MAEIIESVGIEIEFSEVDRKNKQFKHDLVRNLPGYDAKHDASCETPIPTFAGYPVDYDNEDDIETLEPYCFKTVIGGELASPILDSASPDWMQEIATLCDILKAHGETETSLRDSFHVHVNVSKEIPLYVLKNILYLIRAYEAIIFRLGGMGRINRGIDNQFMYQRPFLGNGPPVWRAGREMRIPICRFEHLLGSETREQFFERFGDSIYQARRRGNRYVTQRYMFINFYSILQLGSVEFRTANKTLNPEYIIAWANFCKSFIQKAWLRDLDGIEDVARPLHENKEISDDEFLLSMEHFSYLDNESIDTLLEIWQTSPTPHFDNIWRYSHLNNPTGFSGDSREIPASIPMAEDVLEPEVVDVHELDREFDRKFQKLGQRVTRRGLDFNFRRNDLPDLVTIGDFHHRLNSIKLDIIRDRDILEIGDVLVEFYIHDMPENEDTERVAMSMWIHDELYYDHFVIGYKNDNDARYNLYETISQEI